MTTQPTDLKKLREVRARMDVLFPEEVTVDDLNAWTDAFDSLLDAYEASARDAARWRYACSELTQRYGDGYTEPRECSMSLEWTQGAWIRDGSNDGLGRPDTFPGWSAIVDGMIEEQKRQLDDLDEPDAIDAARHATQGD